MDLGTVIDAVVLGIVEGVTEFLPVSSTAHLLLAGQLLGFKSAGGAFEVLIQFGAILALLSVYAGRIITLLKDLPRDPAARRFALGVIVAFIPAAILGALLHDFITHILFGSTIVICIMLILGGFVLLFIDRLPLPPAVFDVMRYPMRMYLGIGLFQCLALIPGVSRSGATIVGALLLGADKRSAAEFSFWLAMPTMLGAFVYDLYKNWSLIDSSAALTIGIGFVAAFVSALVVVRTFLNFVSSYGFAPFGWWRIVVGIVGLVAALVFG
ncbi:MAG: undecaprenyl-diphosphate phosphatase [Rhizobiales bacterium]|nr:undecaprenyl-diphosphate phosphatase [Hyphomicrobiales bacterium]